MQKVARGLAVLGLGLGLSVLSGCGSTDRNAPSSTVSSSGSGGTAGGGAAPISLGGSASNGGTGGMSLGGASGGAGKSATGGAATGGTATGGAAPGGTSGSGGAAGQPTTSGCTGPLEELVGKLCVAKMVAVTGGYSIDATEVTRYQYQSWLATSPALDTTCTPKPTPSYEPDAKCQAMVTGAANDPDHLPMVCVDWCDAASYCQGVGKRLCGKVGGGSATFDKLADPSVDQWFNACSSGGANLYPYGNTRLPAACNGYDNPAPGFDLLPAGSLPMCQSSVDGYQGVFDLSGNVYEWEDSCSLLDDQGICRIRGGAVVGMLECGVDIVQFKSNPGFTDIGIRCCKD